MPKCALQGLIGAGRILTPAEKALTIYAGVTAVAVGGAALAEAGAAVSSLGGGRVIVPSDAPIVGTAAGGISASLKERLTHIFERGGHLLDDFVKESGSSVRALERIQRAANLALKRGELTHSANGVLPTSDAGNIITVGTTQMRLLGGRIIDGVVKISTVSRQGLP
jgi:hypothetical protein